MKYDEYMELKEKLIRLSVGQSYVARMSHVLSKVFV